jgi:hypothetical protein
MHGLGIPELVTGNYVVAWTVDLLLFGTCIGVLIAPRSRVLVALFMVLYFIYFIAFNTYGTHHTGHKIGVLLIPVPFLVKDILSFNYLWQGLRYVLLFAYSSAFLWKLFRLTWLHSGQGILILKKNLAAYLYYHPNSLYHWLLAHPALVNSLFIAGFLLEGFFIIGFFTRKYDKYLLVAAVLLAFGFWLMAEAFFIELLILTLTFVKWRFPSREAHLPGTVHS